MTFKTLKISDISLKSQKSQSTQYQNFVILTYDLYYSNR
jgi:hypothetical protein